MFDQQRTRLLSVIEGSLADLEQGRDGTIRIRFETGNEIYAIYITKRTDDDEPEEEGNVKH